MQLHRWVNGNAEVKRCENPECAELFVGPAFTGARTGKLYCTRHCRDEMSDAPTLETAARAVH